MNLQMISERFKSIMQSNKGCAVIMAGSDSDLWHIEKIADSLKKHEVPHDIRIYSAHKQPDELVDIIREYNEVGGLVAYIAVAGGTDALSGTLSYHALCPVVSCPPDGLENRTCLTNPPGSSNATIYKAENVGRFIAQIYAANNPRLKEILQQGNAKKINSLRQADAKLQENYR